MSRWDIDGGVLEVILVVVILLALLAPACLKHSVVSAFLVLVQSFKCRLVSRGLNRLPLRCLAVLSLLTLIFVSHYVLVVAVFVQCRTDFVLIILSRAVLTIPKLIWTVLTLPEISKIPKIIIYLTEVLRIFQVHDAFRVLDQIGVDQMRTFVDFFHALALVVFSSLNQTLEVEVCGLFSRHIQQQVLPGLLLLLRVLLLLGNVDLSVRGYDRPALVRGYGRKLVGNIRFPNVF